MKSLKEQLLSLVDLQKIDLKIYNIKKEMKKLPDELNKLKEEFEPRLKAYEKKKNLVKEKEVENMKIQMELKAKEELLKELQEKLYQVKNAKELNAIDAEINTTKKEISELEEKVIKFIDEIDNLKKELKEEEQIIQAEQKNIEELQAQISKEESANKSQLEELMKERKKIAKMIQPQILSDYEFISKNKNGIGIVAVKDGVCTGCYMTLPPQTIHDIRKGIKIYHCQFCARILYYPEWEN